VAAATNSPSCTHLATTLVSLTAAGSRQQGADEEGEEAVRQQEGAGQDAVVAQTRAGGVVTCHMEPCPERHGLQGATKPAAAAASGCCCRCCSGGSFLLSCRRRRCLCCRLLAGTAIKGCG
jgi:hypothetical protein